MEPSGNAEVCPLCGGEGILRGQGDAESITEGLRRAGLTPAKDAGSLRITSTPPRSSYRDLSERAREWKIGPSGLAPSAAVVAGPEEAPHWWMPSLMYLAYQLTESNRAALEALDTFARNRDAYSYAVVEEITDVVVGLSLQPWPMIDAGGRPRFETERDPEQFEVGADEFGEFIDEHRRRWQRLDLVPAELVNRATTIRDTFAVVLGFLDPTLPTGPMPRLFLTDEVRPGTPVLTGFEPAGLPVVDISWDAREIGKLAYHAAAAGVFDPEGNEPDRVIAADANDRYLAELQHRLDEEPT